MHEETGLYYLQSRYYNPTTGRFLNADIYAATGQGLLGNNMFAYCNSNPVVAADYNGEWLNIVIGAAVGAAVGAISAALSGASGSEIWVSVACGAVAGGLAATGLGGLAGQIAVGAVTSAIESGYKNYNDYADGKKTASQAITSTLIDTATGAVFGAVGFSGTNALAASNKVAKNAHKALKALSYDVVHPTVKKAAKAVLRESGKYIWKEFKQSAFDSVTSSAVSYGVGALTDLLY